MIRWLPLLLALSLAAKPHTDRRAGQLGIWEVEHLQPTDQVEADYTDPVELQRLYNLLYDDRMRPDKVLDYFWPNPSAKTVRTIERLWKRWRSCSHKPLIYRSAVLREGNSLQLGWRAYAIINYESYGADLPATVDVLFARADAGKPVFIVHALDERLRDSLLRDSLDYIDRRHLRESASLRQVVRAREAKARQVARAKLVDETFTGVLAHYRDAQADPAIIMATEEEREFQRMGKVPRSFPDLRREYQIELQEPPVYLTCNAIWSKDTRSPVGALELYLSAMKTGERRYFLAAGDATIRKELAEVDASNLPLDAIWPYGEETQIAILATGIIRATYEGADREYQFFLLRAQRLDTPEAGNLHFDVRFVRKTPLGYRATLEPKELLITRVFELGGLELASGPYEQMVAAINGSGLPPSFAKVK